MSIARFTGRVGVLAAVMGVSLALAVPAPRNDVPVPAIAAEPVPNVDAVALVPSIELLSNPREHEETDSPIVVLRPPVSIFLPAAPTTYNVMTTPQAVTIPPLAASPSLYVVPRVDQRPSLPAIALNSPAVPAPASSASAAITPRVQPQPIRKPVRSFAALPTTPVVSVKSAPAVSVPSTITVEEPVMTRRAVPFVVPTDGFSTPTTAVQINTAFLGANTFYLATTPITGQNAIVANIEGGHVWNGHDGLTHLSQFITGAGAVNQFSSHATSAAHAIAWRGPVPGTSINFQGIAYGATLWSGAISTSAGESGNSGFSVSYTSQLFAYRTAMVTGVSGNTADVINSSWGNSPLDPDPTGSDSGDFSRMIDALAFTSRKVVVFAAGNQGPGTNTVAAPAAGYNVISVGALTYGDGGPAYNVIADFSSRSPGDFFIPSVNQPNNLGQGTLIGAAASNRIRVDITAPGDQLWLANTSATNGYSQTQGTSFAAPIVAGGATLLVSHARTNSFTNLTQAIDGRVIKAVLLNSADKTAGWSNAQTLSSGTWTTAQSLDANTGAGRMNLDQAFAQYAPASVSKNTTGLVGGNVASTGWAFGQVGTSTNNSYFFTDSLRAGTEINATLSWFANRYINLTGSSVGGVFSTSTSEVAFTDLNLEVWQVTAPGGSLVGSNPVARSNSLYNVVEHLSFLVPGDGFYMVRVLNAGNLWDFGTPGGAGTTTSADYGIAWMSRASMKAQNVSRTQGAGSFANGLVASTTLPGGPLTLTISGAASSELRFFNSLYIGGNDIAASNPARVTVASGVTLTAYNLVRLYGTSSLDISGTGSFGNITGDAGASVTAATGGTIGLNNLGSVSAGGAAISFGGNGTFTLGGGITGPGNFAKVGSGTTTIIGTSDMTGSLVIGGGTASASTTSKLEVRTVTGTLGNVSSVTINSNSELHLNNLTLGYNANRLPFTVPVTMNSGRLRYDSRAGSSGPNIQQVGNLTASGFNIFSFSDGGPTTELNFNSLSLVDRGTLFFRTIGGGDIGGTPGTATVNVRFGNGITIVGANGSGTQTGIVPFAASNVSNTNIASTRGLITYDITNGVQALSPTDTTYFVQATSALAAGNNNNFNPTSGSMNIGSSPISINSLAVDGVFGQPIMTGGATLTIASGAVTTFFGLQLNGPTLNFGGNTGYIYVSGLDVLIRSTSRITGTAGVVVSSLDVTNNGLVFQSTNTGVSDFTGGLFINGNARVDFTTNAQIGGIGDGSNAAGGITLGGGTLNFSATTGSVTLMGTSAPRSIRLGEAGGSLQANTTGVMNVTGQVTGPGSLSKTGTGIVTLSNATNNYQGMTSVQAGTLRTLAVGVLPSTTVVSMGAPNSSTPGILELQGSSQAIAGLSTAEGNTAGNSNVVTSSTAATLTINTGAFHYTYSGAVTGGSVALIKQGAGSQTLAGTSTYGGTTTVSAGALIVNGSTASATTVASSAAVGGSGTISSTVTVNGIVTPGAAQLIGTFSSASFAANAGGSYVWEVNSIPTLGTQGTNWDFLSVSGVGSGTAVSGSRFTINIVAAGDVNGFNAFSNYSWTIATFGSVSTITTNSFTTTNTNWTGVNNISTGLFNASLVGNNLVINYTAAPEPEHFLLIACLALFAGMIIRQRMIARKSLKPHPVANV